MIQTARAEAPAPAIVLADPGILATASYIDGAWDRTGPFGAIAVTNPADGAEVARVALSDAEGARRAVDAAERAFADLGYGGASIRAIARDADVNQAMVHYYYQNKDQLFSAVVARRADEINARRNALMPVGSVFS